MILEQLQVTHMAVFCYIIGDRHGGTGVLIDPAGEADRISERIDHHQLSIQWIINTHGHWDHTSGNHEMMKRTGAQLLIHEGDLPKLDSMLNGIFSRFLGGKKSPEPLQLLHDGDIIDCGELSLKVIHTPGHSRGCICLYTEGHIFTGDTLFTEGIGRTDLSDGSLSQIMDSIQKKILTLPDDTIIWPGHNYGRAPHTTVSEQKVFYLDE